MSDPLWWKDAQALRDQGLSYLQISLEIGCSYQAAMYALKPDYREIRKAQARKDRQTRRAKLKQPIHRERNRIVEKARRVASDHASIDDLLIAWGYPPRRKKGMKRRHSHE